MEIANKEVLLNDLFNNEANFIPLFSSEDEDRMKRERIPNELPILTLRNTVLFPGLVIPITVGRAKSIKLAQEYSRVDEPIGIITQKDNEVEEPNMDDLYPVGTVGRILRFIAMPDGNATIIVQGIKRFRMVALVQTDPYLRAQVEEYPTNDFDRSLRLRKVFKALIGSIRDTAAEIFKLSPQVPREAAFAVRNIESPAFLVHFLASYLSLKVAEKQRILEVQDIIERADIVLKYMNKEIQILQLKAQIQDKSKQEIDRQQKEYILNEQIKAIQKELGESPVEQLYNKLKEKSLNKKWDKEVQEVFDREMNKLQRSNHMAPDFSTQVDYLELLVNLPWNEYSEDDFDLKRARKVLDHDHYGLEKVKERILEYIAVLKLRKDMKSPIICLVGPPGVGKTSLGRSIANALKRKYIRVSLGGLRDESEIRGHRKTYIGAMPGRIIQSMKKSGTSNPVFVLDEIDKVLGMNVQGDPSAALLEVLDPEQNSTFYDNYLEIGYDLSKVLFIATANTLSTIPPALVDRMEVIDISGYYLEEKVNIAKKHLIPKQMKEHGLEKNALVFSDKIIECIISDYTRESGVRTLEKTLAKIIRHRAAQLVRDGRMEKRITLDDLTEILHAPMYQKEKSLKEGLCGVATGLAWTSVGGEILFIEAVTSPGKGGLTMTGNLGDVMKESATIAYEYIKANAEDFSIDPQVFTEKNIHVHVPEGATPKDGPSAGITMLSAMLSAFTHRKVKAGVAMSGEITLRGKLLPVGGLNEKVLAAKRAGIYDIVLSSENQKEINEIDKTYIENMHFHYFSSMKEAVAFILEKA
ncbi:MAG: endopeptidase La [Bacteroidales bacterium]|nr:endopeptidase La [Bacteroidales bacterium]